jgi:hypothetical protein
MKHCLTLNELSSKLVARLYDAETRIEKDGSEEIDDLDNTASTDPDSGATRVLSDSIGIQELVRLETALAVWDERLPSALKVRFSIQTSQFEWDSREHQLQRQAVVLRTRYETGSTFLQHPAPSLLILFPDTFSHVFLPSGHASCGQPHLRERDHPIPLQF